MTSRPAHLRTAACAALAAVLATAGGNALSLPGAQRLGRYDFGYVAQGDPAARPVQVFSDGAGTVYFQLLPGAPMPAVFAGRELELVLTQPRGPYHVARSTATDFTLALGASRARVRHAEPDGPPSSAEPPPSSPAADDPLPDASGGSPATTKLARAMSQGRQLASLGPGVPSSLLRPIEADTAPREHETPVAFAPGSDLLSAEARAVIDGVAARLGSSDTLVVEGRDDEGAQPGLAAQRAAALKAALRARGVSPDRVVERTSGQKSQALGARAGAPRVAAVLRWRATTPDPSRFEIRRDDGDIAAALRRWAAQAGYELAWDTTVLAPVTGDLRLTAGNFLEAVGQVAAGLRAQGYPLRAQAVGDRIVRFTEVR